MEPESFRLRVFSLAAAAVLFLATEISAQVAVPPGGAVRGEVATRLDGHLSRAERFGFAGAVIVARNNEVILHKGYGLADRASGKRVTAETVFDIGSITKPLTASAVLKLSDEGKIRTTDSIGRFFANVPPDKQPITIHHLLTHTSGLQGNFGGDYDLISRDSLVAVALASKLQSVPGEKHDYSNAGYSLLAAIVEKASGVPYERYLKDHVLEPTGLSSTGYRLVDWTSKPLAVGYRGSGRLGTPLDQRWADDGPSWHLRGNGGLLSTASDLYRWLAAFHAGHVVSQASYAKATTPAAGFDYAYGWGVGELAGGKRFITHNGSNGYFYARAMFVPDENLAIVFMTNDVANRSIENDLLDIAIGKEVKEIPGVAANAISLAPYGGRYRTSTGVEFEIRPTAEGLEILSAPAELIASLLLRPPHTSPADSAIRTTLGAMASGDYAAYRETFWPFRDFRIDDEIEFWGQVLGDWKADYGDYQGARILGTAEPGSEANSQLTTYVALKYSKGDRVLRVIQPQPSTGKFFLATLSPSQWPSRYVLVPRSATEFMTYNLELRKAATLRFTLGNGGNVHSVQLPSGVRAQKGGE